MTRPTLRLLEYRFQFFQKEVLAAKAARARHDMQQLARFEAAARSKAKKSELRKVEKVAPPNTKNAKSHYFKGTTRSNTK